MTVIIGIDPHSVPVSRGHRLRRAGASFLPCDGRACPLNGV